VCGDGRSDKSVVGGGLSIEEEKWVNMIEAIKNFLEKHAWLKKAVVITLIFPYLLFFIWLFTSVDIYPPTLSTLFVWTFLSIIISTPLLLFALLKRKKIGISFVAILVSMFICLLSGLGSLFSSDEISRVSLKENTYSTVAFFQENGSLNYCLYEYTNVFSFKKIDCFFSTYADIFPNMLVLDNALFVFLNGELVYIYGENSLGTTWLDSVLDGNSLFHLRYTESGDETIYEFYKCKTDNIQCVRQPFYFETPSLQYAELYTSPNQPSAGFYIEIGDNYFDSELIYKYGKEPICLVEGCELK
jgi:hypothetical protein